jgi:hypothetical protein
MASVAGGHDLLVRFEAVGLHVPYIMIVSDPGEGDTLIMRRILRPFGEMLDMACGACLILRDDLQRFILRCAEFDEELPALFPFRLYLFNDLIGGHRRRYRQKK